MADGIASLSQVQAAADPSRAGSVQPAGTYQAPKGPEKKAAQGDSLSLSPEAKALVSKLQARDADVRAHEQAHIAAGGNIVTSGASYSYERGPDGRMYAVGGEVSIDASPVRGNPQATLAKAMQIEAAARAPADPSSQDEAVASQAAAMATQAAAELGKPAAAPAQGGTGPKEKGPKKEPGSLVDVTV